MEEWASILLVGSLIPAISFIVKKIVIDSAFKNSKKEILVKNKRGKEERFIFERGVSDNYIKSFIKDELDFESKIKKSLDLFVNNNSKIYDIKMSEGKKLDFLLSYNGRSVGIEAKSSLSRFNTKWINEYFKENAGLDELVLVVNSDIPDKILDDSPSLINGKPVKYISLSKGEELSESINSLLKEDLMLESVCHKGLRRGITRRKFSGQGEKFKYKHIKGEYLKNRHLRSKSKLKHD